jgi:hypothetical protein
MGSSRLRREKTLRLIASTSAYAFALVTLLAAAIIGLSRSSASAPIGRSWWIGLAVLLVATLVVVGCQAWVEYRRRTHDPTWILKYQEMFDGLKEGRCAAASTLIEHKGHLGDLDGKRDVLGNIDDVLDFFDDVGFYQKGGQISPESAHHHFYHWLRMYWQASRDYVEAWQRKESARWNHVGELFEITSEVEMREQQCTRLEITLSCNDLDEYLEQEKEDCCNQSDTA